MRLASCVWLLLRGRVGKSWRSLDGGGGVWGGFRSSFLIVGGVGGGVDICPSLRRSNWGEGQKGSTNPFNNGVTWGPVGQSREDTAETETERWLAGIAGVIGTWMTGVGRWGFGLRVKQESWLAENEVFSCSQRAGSMIQGIPSSLGSVPEVEAPELQNIQHCPKNLAAMFTSN